MPKKAAIRALIFITIIIGLSLFWYEQRPFSDSTEQITLGIAQESLASLAIIANKKGYFVDQGVDVTIKLYKGGKQALIEGILAGNVDLATTADVPIVFNTFQRNDFKVVATIASSDNEPRIVARRDSGISQAQDLIDKKVVTKKASAVHFFLNVFLAHSNVSEDDIELSFLKNGHEMVELLASGKVDAFSHREPFISEAKKRLGDNAIIFEKPGAYTKTFNLIATNYLSNKKPETIKRALKALIMAEKYAREYPEDSIKLVANFIGSSEKALINIWNNINLRVALDQSLITTLEAEALWAISNHLTNSIDVPNYLEHIDASFLQSVKPEAVTMNTKPSK